jgi:hypothetical protein
MPMSDETKAKISATKRLQHIIPKTAFKKGDKPWNTGLNISGHSGHHHTQAHKDFMSELLTGVPIPTMQHEKHPQWKGKNAGYGSFHQWVNRWKPKTNTCEMCGEEKSGHKMHWANIDHKYRRVLDDYIRLCSKCHGIFDKEHGLRLRTNKKPL